MAADDQELANIDAELAKRGVPPESDEMAQLDAEMQRRKSVGGRLADLGQRAAKGMMFGPLGAQVAMMQPAMEALDRGAYNAGGWVTDQASKVAPPAVAAGAGVAANLGLQALPMVLGGEVAKLASPQSQAVARWLMNSALKPTKAEHASGKAARAVDTLLSEDVNVSEGGVKALKERIGQINDHIGQIIEDSNATVSAKAVASRLQDALKKFEGRTDWKGPTKAIEDAWGEFLQHPWISGSDRIPIQTAQKMKQANNTALGEKAYGELKTPATEAQKQLTRGLKEEIAAAEPDVAALNAREGDLINAAKRAQNRVAMGANRNPIGLGAATPSTERLLLWLLDRNDVAKSMLARGMNSGSLPNSAGRVVGAAAGQATVGRRMTEEDLK